MSNEQGKPMKRILAVLDRVESILKSSKSETTVVPFSVFRENIDLLQDFTAVGIAGERISSEAGRDVQVHFLKKTVTENQLTAASGVHGTPVTNTLKEVEMHVGDWLVFNKYRHEVNAKLLSIDIKPKFLITKKGNLAYISLENTETFEPVTFKLGSTRYELIDLLLNKKTKLKVDEITTSLGITKEQLHDAVEGIRSRLSKDLEVQNDDFLIYDDSEGYQILNTSLSPSS